MRPARSLVIVADDFGIGPETSRGILDLAAEGRVTATVLLVNSPHAESAVAAWNRAGRPVELGWHPCLTLDSPISPASAVRSLVAPDGRFWSLGRFLQRILFGRIRTAEVAVELRAQHERFEELVGHAPTVVAAHHHVAVFAPVRRPLLDLLAQQTSRPYLRHVAEPTASISRISGARFKRSMLSWLGRRAARSAIEFGLHGADALAGISDPPRVANEEFFTRRLAAIPGETVELMCHPGYADETLAGRDDAKAAQRVHELHLLRSPDFPAAVRRAGFRLAAPAELRRLDRRAA